MSSLQKTRAGYRVQFRVSGKTQQISLPATKKRAAESFQRHLDELIACKRIGERPQELTRQWVDGLSDAVRSRLEAFGLVESKTSPSAEVPLVKLFDDFLRRRKISAGTLYGYQNTQKKLGLFFGARTADSVTVAEAEDWADFLRRTFELNENSVSKHVRHASAFWRWLVRREVLARNVFEFLPKGISSAADLKPFVPAVDIEAVIAQTNDPQMRLLIALGRWGGLRIPSEPKALRWADVHWEENQIRVTASKTHSVRIIPLFPELREHLDAAWEAAEPGAEWVLPMVHHGGDNFWKQFKDLVVAAGLKPWPKLWSSLRSTRETELAATYPIHVVCSWIGNSPQVALRHYLRPTDTDFERAARADAAPNRVARKA